MKSLIDKTLQKKHSRRSYDAISNVAHLKRSNSVNSLASVQQLCNWSKLAMDNRRPCKHKMKINSLFVSSSGSNAMAKYIDQLNELKHKCTVRGNKCNVDPNF